MTTPWTITPDWAGETVAVLASGPSMNRATADDLKQFRRIAVNHTFQLAPDADMLVALDLDSKLWAAAKNFSGLRVCGVSSDDIDALYAGQMYQRVEMGPCDVIELHNSGLAAIRIAAAMGAARIVLAGFDPDVPGHFAGRPEATPGQPQHAALSVGLRALISELRAAGVVVDRYQPATPPAPSSGTPAAVPPPAAQGRRRRGRGA